MEISIKTVPSADAKPAALSPDRIEPATVLVDVKTWPGTVSGFGKVGAPASLDIHCARRRLSRAGRDGETGSAPNKETDHAYKLVDFERTI